MMIIKDFELCLNENNQEDETSPPRKFIIGFDVHPPVNNCKGHPDNRLPNEEGFAEMFFIRVLNGSKWEDYDESVFPQHLKLKLENKVFEECLKNK